MIGARMLNENERAGLKEQYIAKIDPSIEKYDIEHLFSGIEYAIVDPEIFALYAATDAFMTYKLYEWQLKQFNLPDNKRIFDVFKNVEIPVITVAAQMELDGVEIDKEYATRLSEKYHKKSEELDKLIATHKGITLIGFMGGDNDHERIKVLANYIHEKYIQNTVKWNFKGIELNVPQDVIEYLEFQYGKDWTTPKQTVFYNYNSNSSRVSLSEPSISL